MDGRTVSVALVGNPNVGKSTLFNTLTGLRQHTGNWPGKTVDVASGHLVHDGITYEFVDLPGTYGLSGGSEEERIAAEYITSGQADWTVAVCDGTALERSLILALHVRALTPNFMICISLMDEAERMGISIDGQKLSQILGVPVMLTAAGRKADIPKLLDLLSTEPTKTQPEKRPLCCMVDMAEMIADQCVTRVANTQPWREKVDRILVSRTWGIFILLSLLMGIIWMTIVGANVPSQLLEALLNYGYHWLHRLLWWMPTNLRGILLDGAYATSARVISVMLPPMAIFFLLFSFLEDVGYLPRMAFLLDGGMQKCGGCGKQALTMCMGLGCNAVGVTGCRIIQSPKERLLAVITNAMIPCNGRFPTLIFLSALVFGGWSSFVVGGCVLIGVLGAMFISGVLSKTTLKHEQSYFLMEIPPLRRPRIGQILARSLLDRTMCIAGRALKVAAPAGVLLWIFANFGWLQKIGSFLNPLGFLMGMDGVILLGFLLSIPANELLIPVILITMTGSGTLQNVTMESAGLMLNHLTMENILCMMVFTIFHWPCATTILTIKKETGSRKKTAVAVLLPTAVGVALCALLHFLFQNLC